MQSKATSVKGYLAELPAERRAAIEAVRKVILKNLDRDYEEGMQYGMIGYYVPHRVFPTGYHCDPRQPLPFAALASQKNHMAIYLMCLYGSSEQESWFRTAWAKAGKKLDMGKSCVRFRRLDDLALEVIGEAIRRAPVKKYVETYMTALDNRTAGSTPRGAKPAAAKPARGAAAKGRRPRATPKSKPRGKSARPTAR
ncbi:MAG: DUF1801 domain-containing protein [Phycisphaerae bacterium]